MGTLTSNYEIVKELGRGGMGAVYLANDKRLDRQVAIKMLQVDSSLSTEISTEIIQRFQKEAKAIAKLNHPNIVSIYDIGEENNQYFMVIELLEGQALSNLIEKNEKLSLEKVVDIGIQICSALSYAHKNGIVHRDIKPANIMYSEDGIAKLTDFGIAQLGNDKQLGLTQAGSILGSILYIPPEQLVDSRKVDNKADIYSLGVTLFQLFTGKLPFEGNSVAEVVTKILNTEAPSMKDYDETIPKALDRVILKAIKKDPAQRYQDVSEFGKELTEIYEKLKIRKTKELLNKSSSNANTNVNNNLDKTVIINNKITSTLPKNKATTEKLEEKAIEEQKVNIKKDNSPLFIILGVVSLIVIAILILLFMFSDDNKETPVKQEIKKETPVKQEPIKQEIKKETPVKQEPIKQEIKKETPVKQEPIKQEIKKETPVKQEPKKVIKKIEQKPIIKNVDTNKPKLKKIEPQKTSVTKKVEEKPIINKPAKQENKTNIGEGY